MSIQLKPELDAFLASLGATEQERHNVLNYLLNTLASANGQVVGLDNTITNLNAQRAAAQAEAERVANMVAKFTVQDAVA